MTRKGARSAQEARRAARAPDVADGVQTGASGASSGLGDGAPDVALAVATLHQVCRSDEAPAAARAQAARTLLEMAGALRGEARRGTAPGAELTPEELDAALARALGRESA